MVVTIEKFFKTRVLYDMIATETTPATIMIAKSTFDFLSIQLYNISYYENTVCIK